MPAPAQFKELEGWGQARPRDELPRGSWWTMFRRCRARCADAGGGRVDFTIQAASTPAPGTRVADQARADSFDGDGERLGDAQQGAVALDQPRRAGAVNNTTRD